MRTTAACTLLCLAGSALGNCIGVAPQVFDDMHGGVAKQITEDYRTGAFEIVPYNSSETWSVRGTFDANCAARISVSGTPIYPQASSVDIAMWIMQSTDGSLTKLGFELTDASNAARPLDFWIQDHWPRPAQRKVRSGECIQTPRLGGLVFDDMHDGDMKAVTVRKEELEIKPSGNNQTWTVKATFDDKCVASVNFDVPGKPSPPPVALAARVWQLESIAGATKDAIVFTDPSGTLAAKTFPLNAWVPNNKA